VLIRSLNFIRIKIYFKNNKKSIISKIN